MKRVLILAPYPQGEAPSQRFRFEHYLKFFEEKSLSYSFQSFWSVKAWQILYLNGHIILKLFFLIGGFLRRFKALLVCHRYHFIFIHRELTPIGPPVFEFLIARVLRRKVIYDFDDAIWLPNTSDANSFSSRLKFHSKVASICKMSWKVSVGNQFLKEYALKYNDTIIINPTVVDADNHHSIAKKHIQKQKPVIGWTGTHSTSIYLKKIEPVLSELKKILSFDIMIISNQPPALKNVDYQFVQWNNEQEIEQLLEFDIGVMPLEDSSWEKGKCGFKIIQYLSLGIPAIASPVGVNADIIDHGENGFLVNTEEAWKEALKRLLDDISLRQKLGKNGRKKIVDHYSVRSNLNLFFSTLA